MTDIDVKVLDLVNQSSEEDKKLIMKLLSGTKAQRETIEDYLQSSEIDQLTVKRYLGSSKAERDITASFHKSDDKYETLGRLTEYVKLNGKPHQSIIAKMVLPVLENYRFAHLYNQLEYGRHAMGVYKDLDAALDNYKPGNLLINFPDIQRFGIFENIDKFSDLLMNIQNYIDSSQLSDCTLHQLVISTESQKLAFVCTNPAIFTELCDIINCHYAKADIQNYKSEHKININIGGIVGKNASEIKDLFAELCTKIQAKNSKLVDDIILPNLLSQGDRQYSSHKLHEIGYISIAKLIKELVSTTGFTVNINNNINNGNGTIQVAGRDNNNEINNKKEKFRNQDLILKWVADNPPGIEAKQVYYAKMREKIQTLMTFVQFCKMMKELGYNTIKLPDGTRRWHV